MLVAILSSPTTGYTRLLYWLGDCIPSALPYPRPIPRPPGTHICSQVAHPVNKQQLLREQQDLRQQKLDEALQREQTLVPGLHAEQLLKKEKTPLPVGPAAPVPMSDRAAAVAGSPAPTSPTAPAEPSTRKPPAAPEPQAASPGTQSLTGRAQGHGGVSPKDAACSPAAAPRTPAPPKQPRPPPRLPAVSMGSAPSVIQASPLVQNSGRPSQDLGRGTSPSKRLSRWQGGP